MKDNITLDKSFSFVVRVMKLYKYLCNEKKDLQIDKLKSNLSAQPYYPQPLEFTN